MLRGQSYPCIEIPYRDREVADERQTPCIAGYVVLPREYRIVHSGLVPFGSSVRQPSRHIIYSFLLFPGTFEPELRRLLRELKPGTKIIVGR